jgi:hypothetical protein
MRKAVASFAATRKDFQRKFQDDPEQNIWDWTENHVRSLQYFALCADFNEGEILTIVQWFVSRRSPTYTLTPERFYRLLADAEAYVDISGSRTRAKISYLRARRASGRRKTRKDKGTGARTRAVAELLAAGFNQAEIARQLKVNRSTIHGHVEVIKDLGGLSNVYADLQQPFEVPLSKELSNSAARTVAA